MRAFIGWMRRVFFVGVEGWGAQLKAGIVTIAGLLD